MRSSTKGSESWSARWRRLRRSDIADVAGARAWETRARSRTPCAPDGSWHTLRVPHFARATCGIARTSPTTDDTVPDRGHPDARCSRRGKRHGDGQAPESSDVALSLGADGAFQRALCVRAFAEACASAARPGRTRIL